MRPGMCTVHSDWDVIWMYIPNNASNSSIYQGRRHPSSASGKTSPQLPPQRCRTSYWDSRCPSWVSLPDSFGHTTCTKPQSSSKFLHYFYHNYGKLFNMHDACIGKPIPSIQYMDAIRALFLVKSMKATGLRNMCFKCKQLNWQKRRPSTLPLNIQLYIWPNKKGLCIMKILIYNIYMYLYTIILCFSPLISQVFEVNIIHLPCFITKRPKGRPPNDTQVSKQSEILGQTGITAGQPTPG